MHSVKRILTTENRTCTIRPTAIQSEPCPIKRPFNCLQANTQILIKNSEKNN